MSAVKQRQQMLILQQKTEDSAQHEEGIALEQELVDESTMDTHHEEVVHGEEEQGEEEIDQDGNPINRKPNYGAKKRLIERNEQRRQEVGEPPMYADVALSFDDVETLLLYPETVAAEKVGFTVPSGTQLGDGSFIVSLRSLASPKDIRSDALGKWCTSSTLSRYYQVTGDTFARVDRGGRAPHPDDPWDIKIMNTYSRNPSAGKKLKKNIYERYEANGRMGPFAIITYVWDPDVTPFRFDILPHGNKKYNGARLSRAIQLPPEHAIRYTAEDLEMTGDNDYSETNGSIDMSTGELFESPGSIGQVHINPTQLKRERDPRNNRFKAAIQQRVKWQRAGGLVGSPSSSWGSSPPLKRARFSNGSMDSKERLECEVLALKKEKLRMDVHRMAAETDKLESEREKIEMEKRKISLEIELLKLKKEAVERNLASGRDTEDKDPQEEPNKPTEEKPLGPGTRKRGAK